MSEAPAELWLRPTARRHWYQAQHEPPEPDAVRYVRADDAERWRETVRDIYDMLHLQDDVPAMDIVALIEERHAAFFGAQR